MSPMSAFASATSSAPSGCRVAEFWGGLFGIYTGESENPGSESATLQPRETEKGRVHFEGEDIL